MPNRTIFIATVVLAALVGCRKPNEFKPPPPPEVTVAHPVEKSVADSIEFVGTTEPTQVVRLRARVNGYLQEIFVKDGSEVQAGEKLFQIEAAPYQTVLDAAKAANLKAIANLALARSQYRRMEPLVANGVVTQEELDVQRAQVDTSNADVAAAEAAVRQAELNLGYTTVTAPIAGRMARHMVDVGNLVRAEETELAIIRVIDPIYALFDVGENDLLRFMAMRRNDELPDPEKNPPIIRLSLANEEGFPHEGRLDYREMVVGTNTATARRWAIFPNKGMQLIPGMQVRLQADIGEPKPHLLVDERAIGSDQRGDFLLVVNKKNVVESRPVKTGIHVGPLRVIESGIKADDWIVINGLQRARAGATVKPVPAESMATAVSNADPDVAAAGTQKTDAEAAAKEDSKSSEPKAESSAAAPTDKSADGSQASEHPTGEQDSPPQSKPPTSSGKPAE